MDAITRAPARTPLAYAWAAISTACAVLLCVLMLPFVELIAVVPVALMALVAGAYCAQAVDRRVSRPVRAALTALITGLVCVGVQFAFAARVQGAQTFADLWMWVEQIAFGWLSVPMWLGALAMSLRTALDHDTLSWPSVAWLGCRVYVTVASLGLLAAALRAAAA